MSKQATLSNGDLYNLSKPGGFCNAFGSSRFRTLRNTPEDTARAPIKSSPVLYVKLRAATVAICGDLGGDGPSFTHLLEDPLPMRDTDEFLSFAIQKRRFGTCPLSLDTNCAWGLGTESGIHQKDPWESKTIKRMV